jgi:predicted protein tyrosine phosphatase
MTLFKRIRNLPFLRALRLARLRTANDMPDRRPTEVEPGVFVGGIATRARWEALRAAGVTHVLSLLTTRPPDPWFAGAKAILWLPVPDYHPPTQEQLRAGCAFLDAARARGSGIFIHCRMGVGRGPTVYLAWRARLGQLDVATALKAVQQARPIVSLTVSQREALERWVTEV